MKQVLLISALLLCVACHKKAADPAPAPPAPLEGSWAYVNRTITHVESPPLRAPTTFDLPGKRILTATTWTFQIPAMSDRVGTYTRRGNALAFAANGDTTSVERDTIATLTATSLVLRSRLFSSTSRVIIETRLQRQ